MIHLSLTTTLIVVINVITFAPILSLILTLMITVVTLAIAPVAILFIALVFNSPHVKH